MHYTVNCWNHKDVQSHPPTDRSDFKVETYPLIQNKADSNALDVLGSLEVSMVFLIVGLVKLYTRWRKFRWPIGGLQSTIKSITQELAVL